MSWFLPSEIAQLAFATVLGVIFFYLYWNDRHVYLALWGLSWLVWTVKFICEILLFMGYKSIWLTLGDLSCWLGGGFLIPWGIFEFLKIKLPRIWLGGTITLLLWIVTVVIWGLSIVYQLVPLFLWLGLLYIWAGIVFLKSDRTKVTGKYFAGISILIWGVHYADFPFLAQIEWFAPWGYLIAAILAFTTANGTLLIYYQQIQRNLNQSEATLKLIADNATDVIFRYQLKPTAGIEYISPAVESMTGYSTRDFYSDSGLFLNIVHEDDQHLLSEVSVLQNPQRVRLRWMRKDAKEIWTEMDLALQANPSKQHVAVEGIARDITLQKKQENELLQLHESRRRLLTNISHDLRTPMTTIQGYTEAILDGVVNDPLEVNSYLKAIYARSLGLNRLIKDLFQLARLELRQIPFQYCRMSLESLIDHVYNRALLDIRQAELKFNLVSTEYDPHNIQVNIDIDRLDQVFTNLITNAIKNTPPGGSITLKCDLSTDRQEAIVSVSDSGSGITPEDLPFVFERFYRSSSKENSGTGLGLAICKEIIESHKGYISVESQIGKGSTFYIHLPVNITKDTRR